MQLGSECCQRLYILQVLNEGGPTKENNLQLFGAKVEVCRARAILAEESLQNTAIEMIASCYKAFATEVVLLFTFVDLVMVQSLKLSQGLLVLEVRIQRRDIAGVGLLNSCIFRDL